MKLNYGVVTEYNGKGFGFVQPLSFNNTNCEKVFFHISKVKKTGIEPTLIELEKGKTNSIKLWFITEDTEKGVALKDCWLSPSEIPNEYLVDFVENIEIHLAEMREENSFKPLFKAKMIKLQRRSVNKQSVSHPDKSTIEGSTSDREAKLKRRYNLSLNELEQVEKYIDIYKNNSFKEHFEVNHYISENNLWGDFTAIRSLNDHGENKGILGILPKFYSVVCDILGITGSDGAPLEKSARY